MSQLAFSHGLIVIPMYGPIQGTKRIMGYPPKFFVGHRPDPCISL